MGKMKFSLYTPIRHLRGIQIYLHAVLIPAHERVFKLIPRPLYPPRKDPKYLLMGRLGGP
jgi:hypothetical protein